MIEGNGRKPNGEICVLADGRRVRFFLKRRPRDTCFLACFRGPDELRKERSTKEKSRKRANDAAVEVIKAEYAPKMAEMPNPTWDEAIDAMKKQMGGRQSSARNHSAVRACGGASAQAFPDTYGPSDINTRMAKDFKGLRLAEGCLARHRGRERR